VPSASRRARFIPENYCSEETLCTIIRRYNITTSGFSYLSEDDRYLECEMTLHVAASPAFRQRAEQLTGTRQRARVFARSGGRR
jgi:hypothetical protein